MEEEALSAGFYEVKRVGKFYVFGEFRHTESSITYVAYCGLTEPFTPYVNAKERFVLGLDYPGCHRLPAAAIRVPPGIYTHFKGREYNVHGEFIHALTGELFVCYWGMYEPYARCARLTSMFLEEVDRPDFDYKGPRFVLKHAR